MNKDEEIINNLIQSYLTAIDNKDKNKIKTLYNEYNKHDIEKDVVYEMYKKKELNSERLQFIIENCTAYLNISSSFIKKLMKDNNKELLETLFKYHFKFFDNEFILNLLLHYKNKRAISDSELYPIINNDKFKISTEWNEDFDRYDSSYYLFTACQSGNETAVRFLLEHGADMTIKDKHNRILLAKACDSGNIHLVKYLVHLGADINNEYDYGFTLIFNACSIGNLELVKYLVKCGLDINKETNTGVTPIFYACLKGNIDVVKYLVDQVTDINKKKNNDGVTPLFVACQEGHIDVVKYLVEEGANIIEEAKYGWTPLFIACQNGHIDVVKYLVEQGADINKKDNDGLTPLLIAYQEGHIDDIVEYLLKQGADIN